MKQTTSPLQKRKLLFKKKNKYQAYRNRNMTVRRANQKLYQGFLDHHSTQRMQPFKDASVPKWERKRSKHTSKLILFQPNWWVEKLSIWAGRHKNVPTSSCEDWATEAAIFRASWRTSCAAIWMSMGKTLRNGESYKNEKTVEGFPQKGHPFSLKPSPLPQKK